MLFQRTLTNGLPLIVQELVLNFHGLGAPHSQVDPEERSFWWAPESLARVLNQISDRPADAEPKISITFDDGNDSDALLAPPELARRGLKASFFVCAGRIGRRHYLDRAMIKDLLDAGMRIGSHGMHHRDWRTLGSADLDVEITDARKVLQDVTGSPLTVVAIPFGSYDRRVLGRLATEPWDCVYTSDRGRARVNATIKPRETMRTSMQGRDILKELLEPPPIYVRLNRTISRLYKRWR